MNFCAPHLVGHWARSSALLAVLLVGCTSADDALGGSRGGGSGDGTGAGTTNPPGGPDGQGGGTVTPPEPPAVPLPGGSGWTRLLNTKLKSVCPASSAFGTCEAVTTAWGGATLDSKRNRLIVWGGGHSDYSGNELYALNLNSQTVSRLTDPSSSVPSACGVSATSDGRPTSRHTYNHLAYIESADRMFVFGGASAPCGFMLGDTWTLETNLVTGGTPAQNPWHKMAATGTAPSADFGRPAVYDPNTQKVFLRDDYYLYAYTYAVAGGSYQQLGDPEGLTDYKTATIDTKRHRFIVQVMNQGLFSYDITPGSNYAMTALPTTGGGAIVNEPGTAGFAYDPKRDRIVAWKGGSTVYSLDLTTNVWTTQSIPGGPAALGNGTYGRWAYVPASDVFVVVNAMDDDAFILRF